MTPHPQERTCQVIPQNVSNNVTFILDVSHCKQWEDWKCDSMGVWRNNGVKKSTFINDNGIVRAMKSGETAQSGEKVYTLVRAYYKNKTATDLKKHVSYLKGMLLYIRC